MNTPLDRELVGIFRDEVRAGLPAIQGSLARYWTGADTAEELREQLDQLRSAASLVGLPVVSGVSEVLEDSLETSLSLDESSAAAFGGTIEAMASWLDAMAEGHGDDRTPVAGAVVALRRALGQPEDGDSEALQLIVADWAEPADQAIPPPPGFDDDFEPDFETTHPEDATPSALRPPAVDDFSGEMIEIFRCEAEEHIAAVQAELTALEKDPTESQRMVQIQRSVHTLKGAAGVVGLNSASTLAHRLEDVLAARRPEAPVDALTIEVVQRTLEWIVESASGSTPAGDLAARHSSLMRACEGLANAQANRKTPAADLAPEEAAQAVSGQSVRVSADDVDRLNGDVESIMIAHSGLEQAETQYLREMQEMTLSLQRLRRIAGELESDYGARALASGAPGEAGSKAAGDFDPLELDRYGEFHLLCRDLSETAADLASAGVRLNSIGTTFRSSITRIGGVAGQLHDGFRELQTAAISTLAPRLERAVKVAADRAAKSVRVIWEGAEARLDKTTLDALAGPLEHLLRNSVDHGIETPQQRRERGKGDEGVVAIRVIAEQGSATIEINDDGAGFDSEAILSKAVASGLLSKAPPAGAVPGLLSELIFEPRFSTAPTVTETSGRGVGLDAVRAKLRELGGTVEAASEAGVGTTFLLRLPAGAAAVKLLCCEVRGQKYALPLSSVLRVSRVLPGMLRWADEGLRYEIEGNSWPAVDIGETLSLPGDARPDPRGAPALIVRGGDGEKALLVDRLNPTREALVKPLDRLLRGVRGLSGIALLGEGDLLLVLDSATLGGPEERGPFSRKERIPAPSGTTLDALIVDDSLSVRRVVSKLLTSHGWRCRIARDGVEALENIANRRPDVVLADIEMPNMDGYELLTQLRKDPATASLPVVMLTSRAGNKHRGRALELGANGYLAKPFEDKALLDELRKAARPADDLKMFEI